MRLGAEPYAPREPSDARRAGVAMVYQEPLLCPDLTVAENVLLGVEPSRWGWLDRRSLRARTRRALAEVAGEEHPQRLRPDELVRRLSPADRQLVAIARALCQSDCRVLILDEPTSSLAADDVERLFEAVARLRERGLVILYISHFLEEVQRIADRYTVLRDGRSVATGTMAGTALSEIVRLMVGRTVDQLFVRSTREMGPAVLELVDLAGVLRPVDCSLTLHRGEVLGIAGLVGSGRTELLRVVFGLDPVRRGSVRVRAKVGPASPARRLAQGLGLLSEDRKDEGLALGLSVADNLTLSKLTGLGPAGLVLSARQRAVTERWIERLGIRCRDPEQPAADLSGGNQQKLALGRLLYHDVDVLLLDEPTRGVDVASKAEIYRLIDELACQGKAVLMVSSYLPELLGICDRIAVMRRGRLGRARPAAELDGHQVLMEATGA
jgi:ribose transport system ATP-binding protein